MTVRIQKGHTYVIANDVNETNLADMLVSATIDSISRENIIVGAGMTTRPARTIQTGPNLYEYEVWQHPDTHWLSTDVSDQRTSVYPFGRFVVHFPVTETIQAGHVLASDGIFTSNDWLKVRLANSSDSAHNIIGVAAHDFENTLGASSVKGGIMVTQGPIRMRHTGTPINAGIALKISSTDGFAEHVDSSKNTGFGHQSFAICVGKAADGWVWATLRR